ncbi:MAG TPA: topoisomerase [Thermoplasmata archaeon]|jgi:dTMP kinase
MDYEELHEDLERVLDDLIEKNRTAPIIVEGEWDRRALRSLGVGGDIRVINQGTSLLAVCESIAAGRLREAVILTDWDVRGGRIARQLRESLEACGLRYDDAVRARLAILCRKEIKDVESLHAFVERIGDMAAQGKQQRPSKRFYSDRVARRDTRRRSRH